MLFFRHSGNSKTNQNGALFTEHFVASTEV
jgi:hypothetical protein